MAASTASASAASAGSRSNALSTASGIVPSAFFRMLRMRLLAAASASGLLQDVADALVGRGQRLGFGQGGELADGKNPTIEIRKILWLILCLRIDRTNSLKMLCRDAFISVIRM